MKFSKKVLPNGLRIITVPMVDSPTVTVLVMVETGSKYESDNIHGISHFLEHLCFKGTLKRPKTFDIAYTLDSLGADYNAFTSQEYTGYYAKVDFNHFDTALDVVSDIYLNSTFPEAEIEKEKGVIIEEINMYEDLPQRNVQDIFMELLYGKQRAGQNIAGTKESVSSLKRDDFVAYHKERYVAGSTVVVVSGKIPEDAEAQIQKVFENVNAGQNIGKVKTSDEQDSPKVRLKYKETDQTHFVLGVRTFDLYNENIPILKVLSAILGGGMSSRLFQKVRGEMGAAYYVGAGNDTYTDHGYFEIASGVDSTKTDEVISAVLLEMKKLKTDLVSAEELKKVKDYISGGTYLGLESSDELAEFFAYQEVFKKKIRLPEEILGEIKKVTAEDILRVANQIFVTKNLNLAVIGKYKDDERFLKLLEL